jgi:probable rRNA maturation factor
LPILVELPTNASDTPEDDTEQTWWHEGQLYSQDGQALTITIESVAPELWQEIWPTPRGNVLSALAAILAESSLSNRVKPHPLGYNVSICLSDDAQVQALNMAWRGKNHPTNVLSFALQEGGNPPAPDDEPLALGDIILAAQTIMREATSQGKDFADHASHLLIHGYLHLTGHDHQDPASAAEMEALEIRALARLAIANPYEDGEKHLD